MNLAPLEHHMQATTACCSTSCNVYLLVVETWCKNICRAMAIFLTVHDFMALKYQNPKINYDQVALQV